MNFQSIFVEETVRELPQTQKILQSFSHLPIHPIDKVEDYFGRVKKPYLHKRDSLNLFIGQKKGQLVKEAPPAYGGQSGKHYYFIHAYNCLYECEYCYLQGYFHSPDLVLFINHEEITQEMKRLTLSAPQGEKVWFHAGEFSDSLALSHLTGELPHYFSLMQELPQAQLELRTKSNNIRELLKLPALPNVVVSFSLSPEKVAKEFDHRAPSVKLRLQAIAQLAARGFSIGVHFDPIFAAPGVHEEYQVLLEDLLQAMGGQPLAYLSLGVVRFPEDIYRQMKKNYPQSKILAGPLDNETSDALVRYPPEVRTPLLTKIKEQALALSIPENIIYLCME